MRTRAKVPPLGPRASSGCLLFSPTRHERCESVLPHLRVSRPLDCPRCQVTIPSQQLRPPRAGSLLKLTYPRGCSRLPTCRPCGVRPTSISSCPYKSINWPTQSKNANKHSTNDILSLKRELVSTHLLSGRGAPGPPAGAGAGGRPGGGV